MGTWYLVDKDKDEWMFEDDYIAMKDKEIASLKQQLASKEPNPYFTDTIDELSKQVKILQDKLDNVKYLDKQSIKELKILFYKSFTHDWLPEWNDRKANMENVDKFFDDILSLALPVIDKDRIIEVLNKNIMGTGFGSLTVAGINKVFENIANEILNNKE